ncbi:group 1 glycosyl transferase [Caballeronia udeis]|uniref:Group 1 glycosyl transferase n=1 Tax=Caballeronia udeis TaxID=1232866 RepID=A0A158GGW7_9BURK|nr:glycosyltransferase [Caballeronia udeis]SAL31153.1 group 1 glycosyl transferase [Caballeronia udeis]
MNCESSITLIMDGNFRRVVSEVGSEIVSPHMGHVRFGARFAECFDKVVIGARSFPATEAVGESVVGEGVSFVDLGANRGALGLVKSMPRLLIRLYRQISAASIVLIRFPGNIASLALLLCLLRGKRFSVEVVADPTDYFSASASKHPLRSIAGFVHRWTTRFAARHAVTVRYVTRDYLQVRYPAWHPDKMFGFSDVYLQDALFQTSSVRAGQPDGHLRIINTAMMHNHSKGHLVLLEAMAELRRRDVGFSLTLIGDGVLRGELEAQAAKLGLFDNIRFLGLVDANSVAAHVAQHDLFVLPSYQEGMPRAMLEAMAAGTPVIASNVGGIPEILDETGMVSPGDVIALATRIETLARDPTLLAIRAEADREAARPYGYSTLQSRYITYCAALARAHVHA